ncbi:hypothetical protein GCM10022376_06320 [Yimella lutea]
MMYGMVGMHEDHAVWTGADCTGAACAPDMPRPVKDSAATAAPVRMRRRIMGIPFRTRVQPPTVRARSAHPV